MKKARKHILRGLILLLILLAGTTAQAAVRLNKKTAVMTVGTKLKLRVKGTKNKVTWRSSGKKIAAVTKKGVVTARKKGTVRITAKVNGKKYVCRIQVLDNEFLGLTDHGQAKMTGEGVSFFISRLSYAGSDLICSGFFRNTMPIDVPVGTQYALTITDGAGNVLCTGQFKTAGALLTGGYLDVTLAFGPGAQRSGKVDLRLLGTANADVEMTITETTTTTVTQ